MSFARREPGAHPALLRFTLTILAATVLAAPASAGWVSFHADALGTGASASPHLPFDELWWAAKAPAGAGIVASPVTDSGYVIVADTAGVVRALDARSGNQQWSAKMPAGVEGTPAIAGEHVFVVDTAGNLKSFNLRTGAVEKTGTAGATRGSLAEHEGKLFIGNEAGEVKAFLSDLSPLWTYKLSSIKPDNNATATTCAGAAMPVQPVRGKPAVFDGAVYVGSLNHYIVAIDEAGVGDGKTTSVRWIYQTGDLVDASPSIVSTSTDDYVVVGSFDGTIYAFEAHQPDEGESPCMGALAEPAWTFDVPGTTTAAGTVQPSKVHSSAATADGRIFVGANSGQLYALDAEDGSKLWNTSIGTPVAGVNSSPAVGNSTVVVGSDDAHVYWLEPSNGTILRTFAAASRVSTSPALDGELAYVAAADGTLYAFGPIRPPEPDLVVTSITANATHVTVAVSNKGNAASNDTVTLRVMQGAKLLLELKVPALSAGENKTFVRTAFLPEGKVAITAELDVLDAVPERDEANNRYAGNVTIVALQEPDLNATGNDTKGKGKDSKFLGIPSLGPALVIPALALTALAVRSWRRRGP